MFTTECGNPGIRKSMFTLFSIFCSWLEPSRLTTTCPDLSCTFSTLGSLLSSDERVWFYSFRQRVAPISLKRQFQREKYLHRTPGNRTFFFHLARFWCELRQRVAPICDDFGLELVGSIGKLLDCCTTYPSGCWACSEPNSLFPIVTKKISWKPRWHVSNCLLHLCLKEIFGRRRSDANTSYLTSPISIRTTFGIL